MYYFSVRACPIDEARPSTTIDEDFNTELDELLRRDDYAYRRINMVLSF